MERGERGGGPGGEFGSELCRLSRPMANIWSSLSLHQSAGIVPRGHLEPSILICVPFPRPPRATGHGRCCLRPTGHLWSLSCVCHWNGCTLSCWCVVRHKQPGPHLRRTILLYSAYCKGICPDRLPSPGDREIRVRGASVCVRGCVLDRLQLCKDPRLIPCLRPPPCLARFPNMF